MSEIIEFPGGKQKSTSTDVVEDRVIAVDRVTQMHPDELKQAVQVVEADVEVEWINQNASLGITHRIGSNVFRRVRENSRILASDDVGVVSSTWLEANFQALNDLRQLWGGRITMVWNLVRVEGYTAPGYVEDIWNRIVAGNSPLDRIIVVQNFDMRNFPASSPLVPEPIIITTPDKLEALLDQVEDEHTQQQPNLTAR